MKLFKKEMRNPLNSKKKSKPSVMACNHCSAKKVSCYAPHGIGTPCQRCTKAERVCQWPLTPEQDLATPRRPKGPQARSCTICKAKKIRCNRGSGPCNYCAVNGLSCSRAEVAQPVYAEQSVAEPPNQGTAASSHYNALPHQIGNGAGPAAYPPSLSIDTSMDIEDIGGSVTPSSGPSSPRSYWETVLNQEYSTSE